MKQKQAECLAGEQKPKCIDVNRKQLQWRDLNLEESIGPEHPAGLMGALWDTSI